MLDVVVVGDSPYVLHYCLSSLDIHSHAVVRGSAEQDLTVCFLFFKHDQLIISSVEPWSRKIQSLLRTN